VNPLTIPPTAPAQRDPLLESLGFAVIAIDSRGEIDYLNPAGERLFGHSLSETRGQPFTTLLDEAYRDEVESQIRNLGHGESSALLDVPREVMGCRENGTSFAMELILSQVQGAEPPMLVALARDIEERKWVEEELRHLVDHDPLTGLLNRRSFERELSRHIAYAARYGEAGSVVTLGVDHFKYVNDSLGHGGGDELLKEIAALLGKRLRRTDILARLSSDIFTVLLHGAGEEKARVVAGELIELVRKHSFVIERQPVRVMMSAGVAPLGDRPVTGPELLAEADIAMYSAKEQGGDQVACFSADGNGDVTEKRAWSERVRQATEKGLFVLVCQPILNLAQNEVTQYELLIRMRGEDGELVPPAAFLATAERFGLIQAVDRWVAQQAIRLIAAHQNEGRKLTLEVNLSGKTMGDAEFTSLIKRELKTTGIDPAQLVFEVTETAAVHDMDKARRFAQELIHLGCRFALDDFGAGFGSFYYLKHLPISYLKIDGEFVKDLPRTPADRLVVKAVVDICQGLGIKTVAEFVGDEETVELLTELGVDFAQGYHVGRPHPVAELRAPTS
jgi:diguanylate cyclase (GGDEF)-like protein/PAS domain S-box-containing protein